MESADASASAGRRLKHEQESKEMNRRCFRFGLSRVARLLFGVLLTLAFVKFGYGQNPLIFDFESGNLDGWTIVEGANTKPIGSRDLEFHAGGGPYDKSGKYYLN